MELLQRMNDKHSTHSKSGPTRKILLLHGDRQTGQLLLGRIGSLKRKLLKPRNYDENSGDKIEVDPSIDPRIELVAPDGPFVWELDPSVHKESKEVVQQDHEMMRTWWYRDGNDHRGLDESLELLHSIWLADSGFEGILGFSRGARITHFIALLHTASNGKFFPNLKYIMMASGYGGVSLPSNFPPCCPDFGNLDIQDIETAMPLHLKSMHIMGTNDKLVTVESSRALLSSYVDPLVHQHDGGHHIPMRAADVRSILKFIDSVSLSPLVSMKEQQKITMTTSSHNKVQNYSEPDEEHAQMQIDECESMSLIFPEEFQLLSHTKNGDQILIPGETEYIHPISYAIQLKPCTEQLEEEDTIKFWPKKDIALKVQYNTDYPDTMPSFSLHHDMNLLEFKISQSNACIKAVEEAAQTEEGMPCVMSCVYAARQFFESGGLVSSLTATESEKVKVSQYSNPAEMEGIDSLVELQNDDILRLSSVERIEKCIIEGLELAYHIAGYPLSPSSMATNNIKRIDTNGNIKGKGGSWKYTIGLVGKPSAGKSTFFNAATAFARQRGGDTSNGDGLVIGGATMAPHPFTTIDPNVGYCLVPTPIGSCPEDDCKEDRKFSSTHGRDSHGKRLIPVMLKDVAGLVPGAYQGRGRGNKFLDDLLDADVLIHVLDSSGSADTEGNTLIVEGDISSYSKGSNPLDDIAWIHGELLQWIVTNLRARWNTITRKGRGKLVSMFSGYKQSQAFVLNVLSNVEKFLLNYEGRDHALDHLSDWDEGDLYRLVATFLGVRFPTALALNKSDLPSSKHHCEKIQESLPLHGAHVGVAMSAHHEMQFVQSSIITNSVVEAYKVTSPPNKVFECLQAAMKLREPLLVFPVFDMETYEPLPGMFSFATRDASLPNKGMISFLEYSGGEVPTMWDKNKKMYHANHGCIKSEQTLRDCIVMKPNSTVEDVFVTLKQFGALDGEFVRAEGAGGIGEKPKLVKKDDFIGKHNRILKIMTTKRREWQKSMHE